VAITKIIGAVLPTTTVFIGALVFVLLLAVQFSVTISKLNTQVKNLVQENALLRTEIAEMGGDN
jgi:hypothetical protein